MEFDKSRVYTSVNADELKVGSKVVCANTIIALEQKVANDEITEITDIKDGRFENRFSVWTSNAILGYALAYLVSEPEEKKLKWTDLKVGDVIRDKSNGIEFMITGLDKQEGKRCHIRFADTWVTDSTLKLYEKVEE